MKIGILTASRTDNNGTDLQAKAMLNMFIRLGASNVELINYICPKLESKSRVYDFSSIKKILYFPKRLFLHLSHERFRKEHFKRSHIYNSNNISQNHYDTIVVGSDQIWNIPLTGYDLNFFLPFASNGTRKYSYAASIGRTDIKSLSIKYGLKDLLSEFDGITVREESGVSALSEIGVNAKYALDPILMGNREDWNTFIEAPAFKTKYILLYLITNNSPAINYAKTLAKQKGYKIINCSPGLKHLSGIINMHFVGVEKWLNLVANAELVLTSSYHCLSFCLLFHTEFYLMPIENAESNARMQNLLERFELSERVLQWEPNFKTSIDWSKVDNKLQSLRFESEQYVKSIIEK